jgi:tRNA (uracil-5-)-methyltransferase
MKSDEPDPQTDITAPEAKSSELINGVGGPPEVQMGDASGDGPEDKPSGSKRAADEPPADDETNVEAQVRIDNLPKYATKKDVLHRLEVTLGVKAVRRLKKQPNQDFGFVYFVSGAARYEAEKLIEGHTWKGVELRVRQAIPLAGDRFAKRQRGGGEGGGGGSSGGHDAEPPRLRTAAEVVTPLHGMAYSDQLVRKRQGLLEALRKIPAEMRRASNGVPPAQKVAWGKLPWLNPKLVKAQSGSPVPLGDVVAARLVDAYRNKCEFSFGRNSEGAPCLGFHLGQIRHVGAVIGPPSDCQNVTPQMKAIVSRVQGFLGASLLQPYDKVQGSGFWRQLTIRQAFDPPPPPPPAAAAAAAAASSSGDGDAATPMLLLFLVQRTAAAADVAAAEESRLVECLLSPGLLTPVKLSIAFGDSDGPGEASSAGTERWVVGPPYVEERLLGLTYRVSPSAFFQVSALQPAAVCACPAACSRVCVPCSLQPCVRARALRPHLSHRPP